MNVYYWLKWLLQVKIQKKIIPGNTYIIGYDVRATNTSAYGVTEEGLKRSFKLDQLTYYCQSCPRNKYSLDFGFVNYTIGLFLNGCMI